MAKSFFGEPFQLQLRIADVFLGPEYVVMYFKFLGYV